MLKKLSYRWDGVLFTAQVAAGLVCIAVVIVWDELVKVKKNERTIRR
jgi:hypothetical protein